MTSAPSTTSTSSNFEALFDAALAKYTKRTGQDLRNHPIATTIDRCQSPDAILEIFQEQSRHFDEFRNGDPKLIKFLTPIVNGLYAISNNAVLSAGASLMYPPASLIFSGIGLLLSTAKYVRQSYDTLVDIFDCIENFTRRLKIYTEIQPTLAMTETIVKIMVELLSVLSLTTEEMYQGKLKKYAKKLLGENKVEAVLQRLDRLTLEESKMTVAQTLDVVCGLVNNMEAMMQGGKTSTDGIQQALVFIQAIATKINKLERDQLQERFRSWLSSPDPWPNHDLARKVHHHGTAKWFTQGKTFAQWKSTGSLLWVNGLPGSGKTIISSSIIEDLQDTCRTGLATLAIFYCDFRDTNKQDARNLLSSILIQLCQQSDKFSQVLSSMYSTHGNGSRVPSTDALLGCLKTMLALQGQATLYVVLDAIDECPNSPGLLTQREEVLEIVKELIDLKLPHLCFCVTSRPEIDIRNVLEPLNPYNVSLHNQHGQKEDLERYVKSIVHSDREMRNWPEDVKILVVDALAKKSSGMFRWAYCQLETLRWCPLRDIPTALKELPKTLDRTYERILQDIPERMQKDAHRIIQWLTVSSRPMCVDELAEVFAINFDAETSGIPKFDPSWRPLNAEAAVLSACSTLVSVVNHGSGKVVQFAHFSVKEYLTSDRHCKFACLSVLLQLDYSIDETKIRNFPLASYAAKHWMDHARFEDVSSHIRHGMDILFDRNKPHLAAWIWLFEVGRYNRSPQPTQPDAAPLYHAALCGIRILVERLLDAHSQDVNSWGGFYRTPLFAALGKEHPDISILLLERGADVESRDRSGHTALYMSSSRGYSEVVRVLIDRGADLNAGCDDQDDDFNYVKWTPLFIASKNGRLEVAKMLLDHGADVNHEDSYGKSPLHIASRHSSTDLVLLLLDRGANHNALDTRERNALHFASSEGQVDVVTLLLQYGMDLDTRSQSGSTPLHYAAMRGQLEVLQLLLDYDADVNAQNIYQWTALHLSAWNGHLQIVEVLLTLGADLHAQTDQGETPFQLALRKGHTQVARLLLERNDSMWTM